MDALDTGDCQQSPPTSSSGEKFEGGGAGAGLDLAAMLESSLKEARRYVNNPAAPHVKWMCMFSIGQTEALLARVRVLEAVAEAAATFRKRVSSYTYTVEEEAVIRALDAALAAAGRRSP